MSDIIQLLPDSIANQIAAGEVVQRPASAVKELLENALDAGATNVQLIIKDGGRTLIQVTDNGCGMSDTDARLCFERHATSKIRKADDLFAIRTMGFRGEALASIAAVARVELKTKMHDSELGTSILIEGSDVKVQEPCQTANGTSISVKDLFFNIPARRNFLKGDNVELSHIEEEFRRVALVNIHSGFSFYNNGKLLYKMEPSTFHQRIVSIFGNNYRQRLCPVEENTDIVKIKGYVCKAEFAKKTRGEQYLFVNKRFIKNYYLGNAVEKAFAQLLPEKNYPSYFIELDVEPSRIDVNIHPTKTEVKFLDERYLYPILQSAVKRALGQFSVGNELEFNHIEGLDFAPKPANYVPKMPEISIVPGYNPFDESSGNKPANFHGNASGRFSGPYGKPSHKPSEWEKFYETANGNDTKFPATDNGSDTTTTDNLLFRDGDDSDETGSEQVYAFQVNRHFIVSELRSGLLIIDQQRATERILYERYLNKTGANTSSQLLMFPHNCSFSAADSEILSELIPEMKNIGFEINALGKNSFVVSAIPADMQESETEPTVEQMIADYKCNLMQKNATKNETVALAMARRLSTKNGKSLQQEEMQHIIAELFTCSVPDISPSGKKIMTIMNENDLTEKLR